ncbi:MAG: hypothetical protein MUC83_04205 [Pirellula sp.]|jgi:hypothetical protein|nr:hypothetical protein [Pirellula sp.]
MRFSIAFVVFMLVMQTVADAGLFRRGVRTSNATTTKAVSRPAHVAQAAHSVQTGATIQTAQLSTTAEPSGANQASVEEVTDALAEVNAARVKRGLRPFQHDPQLTQAALQCAQIRASRRIAGHLPNDFAYLPAGSTARSAGCGAMEPSWGWGTCCTYENYTYAGAAWVMGADGKRYMHLFVR